LESFEAIIFKLVAITTEMHNILLHEGIEYYQQ